MFIDSSALVAMVIPEPDGAEFMVRLEAARDNYASPVVVFESVLAIRRIREVPVAEGNLIVGEFLRRAGVRIVAIEPDDQIGALQAFDRYGKGTTHPAQLDMGYCFSYAVTTRLGVPLLYKGNDFAQTDLA